jgi:hypothetical protein
MFAKMFPGAYVVILKIFSAKNWRFWLKTKINNANLRKNANFFRQKCEVCP